MLPQLLKLLQEAECFQDKELAVTFTVKEVLMHYIFFENTTGLQNKHNTNIHRVYTSVLQTYWGFVTPQVILKLTLQSYYSAIRRR